MHQLPCGHVQHPLTKASFDDANKKAKSGDQGNDRLFGRT